MEKVEEKATKEQGKLVLLWPYWEYSLSSLPAAASKTPERVIDCTAVSASEGESEYYQAAGAKHEMGWKLKGGAF